MCRSCPWHLNVHILFCHNGSVLCLLVVLLTMFGMLQISWSAKHYKERNWHSCIPSLLAGVCFL